MEYNQDSSTESNVQFFRFKNEKRWYHDKILESIKTHINPQPEIIYLPISDEEHFEIKIVFESLKHREEALEILRALGFKIP